MASISWHGETRLWDISLAGNVGLGTLAFPDGVVWQTVEAPGDGRVWATVDLPGDEQQVEVVDPTTGSRTVVVGGLRTHKQVEAVLADDASSVAGLDAELLGHVYDLPSGEERLQLRPCQAPKALDEGGSLLIVDGQTLCPTASGESSVRDAAGAMPNSAVLDGRTGEELIDLGERFIFQATFGVPGTPAEHLAAVTFGPLIELYDLRTRALIGSLDLGGEWSVGKLRSRTTDATSASGPWGAS
jgi:hypothetical protein